MLSLYTSHCKALSELTITYAFSPVSIALFFAVNFNYRYILAELLPENFYNIYITFFFCHHKLITKRVLLFRNFSTKITTSTKATQCATLRMYNVVMQTTNYASMVEVSLETSEKKRRQNDKPSEPEVP